MPTNVLPFKSVANEMNVSAARMIQDDWNPTFDQSVNRIAQAWNASEPFELEAVVDTLVDRHVSEQFRQTQAGSHLNPKAFSDHKKKRCRERISSLEFAKWSPIAVAGALWAIINSDEW